MYLVLGFVERSKARGGVRVGLLKISLQHGFID